MKAPKSIVVNGQKFVKADSYPSPPTSKVRVHGILDVLSVVTQDLFKDGWIIRKYPRIDLDMGGGYLMWAVESPYGVRIKVLTSIRGRSKSILHHGDETEEVFTIKPSELIEAVHSFLKKVELQQS